MADRCTARSLLLFACAIACGCGDGAPSRASAGQGAEAAAGTPVSGMPAPGGAASAGTGTAASNAANGGGGVAVLPGGSGGTSGSVAGASGAASDGGGRGGSVADAGEAPVADAAIDAGVPPAANLPAGVRAMFPLPDAQDVCVDPPLRIEFAAPPVLGARGRVQIWSDADTSAPKAELNLAAGNGSRTIGGMAFTVPRPAYVDGNSAVFYLTGKLARGQRYHVTIEDGALRGPDGAFTITDATTWKFATAARGSSDATQLAVGLAGGTPFCSVQGALDAVPANNATATTIAIGAGTYHEVLYVQGKDNLTLRGADRKRTVIAGVNNNDLNPSTKGRALVGMDNVSGLVIETLTIHNQTPQGGSQAEALRLQGCDRCVVRDADILSLQDTLLWSGRLYAEDCFIAGNVDFVWGTGAAFFSRCEIKTVGRAGYIVQARNGAGGYGYVFVDSKLTSDPGVSGNVLARVDASVYPQSHVAFVDCELGPHISAAGWTVTGGAGGSLRFWEYQSKRPGGGLVDVSQRHGASRQLNAAEAAMMRDPAVVLGGWKP